MSVRHIRHDPTGLVDLLAELDGPSHAAVREEVVPRETEVPLTLVRCRCGRLFEADVLEDHLESPEVVLGPRNAASTTPF